jgi:hypothetical protein
MNRIPGLALCTSIDVEMQGIDYDQFNEYTHDYIHFERDLYVPIPKLSPINSLVTMATIDNQNMMQRQNDIKMIKMNSIPMTNNAW